MRPDSLIELVGPAPRFVSRGGDKLAAALDAFAIRVDGRLCLDAGASTGGFTDCLLQAGAGEVIAVDVGHGQLDPSVRGDPRVRSYERCNVRDLTPAGIGGLRASLVVADLSFISLATVASALTGLTEAGGDLVVLVKPQYEAGRAAVAAGGGVVRDPVAWSRSINRVRASFVGNDSPMTGLIVSPLTGSSGNVEFLAHLRPGAGPGHALVTDDDIETLVASAARREQR